MRRVVGECECMHTASPQDMHAGCDFHNRQLSLYASLAPSFLATFLRQSSHYSLETALDALARECVGGNDRCRCSRRCEGER